ncbi:MAG: hypothetical protein AB7N24_02770 [Dehalococcoidia bacterium]
MKQQPAKWELDWAEVEVAGWESTSRKRPRPCMAKHSRAMDVRSIVVTLRHIPTGVEVSAGVPEGHYSKKEMARRRSELSEGLRSELEAAVAKHLRLPGR